MATIKFDTKLIDINGWIIVHLPTEASAQLSSRGLGMVKGTVNDAELQTTLEPDGNKGHWFALPAAQAKALGVSAGDTVSLELEPTKDWIEPEVPADILKGLQSDGPAYAQWQSVTPMARWEWIRWIRATTNPDTRAHHIEVANSKLRGGARRPCCFNASMCTVMEVSKSGVLLDPVAA